MRFNLILAFFWLFLGVPLLVVNLTPVRSSEIPTGRDSLIVGALAIVLSLYNFVRWYASRSMAKNRAKQAEPPKKRRIEGARLEYNPEFDFKRQGPQTLKFDDEPANE